MEQNEKSGKTPEIYCAISLVFDKQVDSVIIQNELRKLGITRIKISEPRCEPVIVFDIAVVYYEHFWEIDGALSVMFSLVGDKMDALKKLVCTYDGEICVDIAINQFGTAPALLFSGDNMKKIHQLNANISIDIF